MKNIYQSKIIILFFFFFFVFGKQIADAIMIVDDFNDNAINTNLWSAYQEGEAIIEETNQRLEITIPSTSVGEKFGAGYSSFFRMHGNFDIQVDYELLIWPPENGVRVGMLVGGVDTIERKSVGTNELPPNSPSEIYLTNASDGLFEIPTNDSAGTFRLVRKDSTISAFYSNYGYWNFIHSWSAKTGNQDVTIVLAAWSHDNAFADQEVKIAFDNFIGNDTAFCEAFLDADNPSREVQGAAADGISQVIIQIDGVNSNDNIEIIIPEGDGHLEGPAQIIDGVFKQTYVAPRDFNYPTQGKRPIDLKITVNDNEIPHGPFYLIKPPVVLIHGLWGDFTSWKDLTQQLDTNYFFKNGYPIFPVNYCNYCSFEDNRNTIALCLKGIIDIAKNSYNVPVVVKKVDIVAHSMGGILTSLYVTSSNYANNVNRIITVGTPFSGSQLANYSLDLLYKKCSESERSFWVGILKNKGNKMGPAVFELQVGSNAINNFISTMWSSSFPVPVYSITCDGLSNTPGRDVDLLYWLLDYLDKSWNWGTYFNWGFNNIEQTLFGTNNTDFVVSFNSQRGGNSVYTSQYALDHISETTNNNVITEIIALLNTPISNFSTSGFKPSYLTCPILPVIQTVSSQEISKNIIQQNEGASLITIISPQDGSVHEPGETVHVAAECQGNVNSILFVTPFGWFEDKTAPYEYDVTIDTTFIGKFEVDVVALGSNGMLGNGSVTLFVEPSSSLQSIRIWPLNTLTMSPNDIFNVYVEGLFSDGIARDLTFQSTTHFTSLNPSIATIDEKGSITAISPGETVITVENNNIAESINITVEQTKPTLITLSTFIALPKTEKISLQWATESEISNSGFNIYRSESESGDYIKINTSMIPAKGSSTQGASYEFVDTNVQNRKTYWYKLEDIDISGKSTMHGPVSATPRLIYGLSK